MTYKCPFCKAYWESGMFYINFKEDYITCPHCGMCSSFSKLLKAPKMLEPHPNKKSLRYSIRSNRNGKKRCS